MSPLQTRATAKAAPPLRTVIERIEEISSLPQVALRVMEVANDPSSGAADLKEAMEGDTALSARVLRCVNSSAYALRSQITNLQQAIAYLGTKQIRNLAMMITVSDLFKDNDTIGSYRRSDLCQPTSSGKEEPSNERKPADTGAAQARKRIAMYRSITVVLRRCGSCEV